jgi:hypothetical protein
MYNFSLCAAAYYINFKYLFLVAWHFRNELLNAVMSDETYDIPNIALQPGNSTGAVFAAATCLITKDDWGSVKIFDIRRSVSGKS